MYLMLGVSYWLVLILSVPAAGFLLRTYILFHDCAHGSFLRAKRTNTWTLSGKATEGGLPVASLPLQVARGLSVSKVVVKSSTTTGANGAFRVKGKLVPKKTTYFQVSGHVAERDYTATGCQSPLTLVAPAGCVKATLSPWSAKSVVVRVKP